MNCLVIFRLPDNKFVSCDLARLAAFPVSGHVYLFNKQQFEVVDAVEPLTGGDGNSQILDLVNMEFDNATDAAAALASMVNLDAKLETKVSLATTPDKVVLVRLKKATKGGKTAKPKVGAFNLDVQSLLSGAGEPRIDISTGSGSGRSSRRRRTGSKS